MVFNDDGYADEWQVEAAERGLPNLRTTLDALPELITEESMELFSHYGVFNHREMHSRYEIALEQYILAIDVEAALTLEMANTIILPAAVRYQTELATNLAGLKKAGIEPDTTTFDEVSGSRSLSCGAASPRSARRSTTTTWSRRRSTPSTPRRGSCRPWPRCGPQPTPSRHWSPTTSGRCPPIRRCSSSSDDPGSAGGSVVHTQVSHSEGSLIEPKSPATKSRTLRCSQIKTKVNGPPHPATGSAFGDQRRAVRGSEVSAFDHLLRLGLGLGSRRRRYRYAFTRSAQPFEHHCLSPPLERSTNIVEQFGAPHSRMRVALPPPRSPTALE